MQVYGYKIYFDGVVDFFNKNGEEIDDMNYPLESDFNLRKWRVLC